MLGSTAKIDQLLEWISLLDYNEKINVMESIIDMLKTNPDQDKLKNQAKLKDLKGLGAEIWRNEDVARYIQEERSWD